MQKQTLFEKIKYLSEDNQKLIQKAYDYAEKKHQNQFRLSKEPYIIHPLAVALILADLKQDASTISAGLLHDTLEDCDANKEELIELFGDDIYHLVEGVTKLNKLNFTSEEEHLVENFRKLFLAMAKDLRVVVIKLADRLHNMRTLKYLTPERQIRMAKETKEIFAPLAHRLGIGAIKWELEDLAFYYLHPQEFRDIKKLVASKREEREQYINNFVTLIKEIVFTVCTKAYVSGRPKHFFSIYKKMQQQHCSYEKVYDTLGVRIIVENINQCYEILGLIHGRFKPITGRIKDFIAMPKSNMYQSLHTTVIGPEGKNVELQIRTFEMDAVAENGIAAHWRYKEDKTQTKFNADFSWITDIISILKEKDSPGESMQNLKLDLFEDEVFIFTPKGDVQVLPKGATPLDFAYKVHTEIGHTCIGAKVQGEIVPLDYVLKSGDQLEILTSKKSSPKISWLDLVTTHQAKTKIKQWFKKQNFDENLIKGKTALEQSLINEHFSPKEVFNSEDMEIILKKFNLTKLEELYIKIAHTEITPQIFLKYLKEIENKKQGKKDLDLSKIIKTEKKISKGIVKVLGESNIPIQFAKCCTPIPGDDIIGFITKGYGVTVHRQNCKNIINMSKENQPRLIEVTWSDTVNQKNYAFTIVVEAFDRMGLLKDIISKITETKTNIIEIKSKTIHKGGNIRATIVVDIQDFSHFDHLKKSIQSIADVYNVYRA